MLEEIITFVVVYTDGGMSTGRSFFVSSLLVQQ